MKATRKMTRREKKQPTNQTTTQNWVLYAACISLIFRVRYEILSSASNFCSAKIRLAWTWIRRKIISNLLPWDTK